MPPGMESYFRSFLCIFQHPGLSLRSGTVSVLRCGPGGTRTPMQPIILSTHYECEGIQAQNQTSKTHPPFHRGEGNSIRCFLCSPGGIRTHNRKGTLSRCVTS